MKNWDFIESLDEGGYGVVYKVRNKSSNKIGAAKFIKNSNAINTKRFVKEIKIINNLNHNNIIKILDFDVLCKNKYYVMEFMTNKSLLNINQTQFIQNKKWGLKESLNKVIIPTLKGLNYAHGKKIIHRDLKPANLLFNENDTLKIADWGLGKDLSKDSLKITMGALGTPGYCSPEQWNLEISSNYKVDLKTDIYSLGIIFYEMLTGKIPEVMDFSGQKIPIVECPSKLNKKITKEFDKIIFKMISYEKENRYNSVIEIINDFKKIINNSQNISI